MHREIVAVLVDRTGADVALKAAFEASLALRAGLVSAFHVFVDPRSTILPTEEMMSDDRRRELEAAESLEEAKVLAIYQQIAGQLGKDHFEWRQSFGTEGKEVTRFGTEARLIVMPMPGQHASGYVREAFHAALFETERPLLIVPLSYRRRSIERIVIGWNDDESCVASIAAAEPWLRRAANVGVIHVGAPVPGSLDKAKSVLAKMEIEASFRMIEPSDAPDGARILEAAVNADWLIIGGYHHKQLLEWFLGGVTKTVFRDSTIPVFTMH